MELKEYQKKTLDQVKRYLEALAEFKLKNETAIKIDPELSINFPQKAGEKTVGSGYLSKKNGLGEELPNFYLKIPRDLFVSIRNIATKVKYNGHVCFFVGNRRVKGEELPTDKISADFFNALGFQYLQTIVRAISNKRMPTENAPSNIRGKKDFTMRYEYIVNLKKNK